MSQTLEEQRQIEAAYISGQISYEERTKLLNDITPLLWNELMPFNYHSRMRTNNERTRIL